MTDEAKPIAIPHSQDNLPAKDNYSTLTKDKLNNSLQSVVPRLPEHPASAALSQPLTVNSSEAPYASYKRLKLPRISFSRSLEIRKVLPHKLRGSGQFHLSDTGSMTSNSPRSHAPQTDAQRYPPWDKLAKYSWKRSDGPRGDAKQAPDRFYRRTYGTADTERIYVRDGLKPPASVEDILSENLNASSRRRRLVKTEYGDERVAQGKSSQTQMREKKTQRQSKGGRPQVLDGITLYNDLKKSIGLVKTDDKKPQAVN